MYIYLNCNKELFYSIKGDKYNLVPPVETARLLIKHSNLEHLRVYPAVGAYFIYDNSEGIYKKVNLDQLMCRTSEILDFIGVAALCSYDYVRRVVSNLLIGPKSYHEVTKFDHQYMIFTNGVLNLYSFEFHSFSPNYFCTSKVSFAYDPSANCPLFLNFLDSLCGGHKDRMVFLQAWFNAVIFQRKELQVFLFLLGPAATGKSMFAL